MSAKSRSWSAIAAAWILGIGFDLFLHGGLLARLYVGPSSFLLPPEDSFRRIPLGYLALLILVLALAWLFRRLAIRGSIAGFRMGATAGAVAGTAFLLGLYSISTASIPLLLGWWIGQSVELGLAGSVLGAGAGGTSMKRVWAIVVVVFVALLAATIVLQSTVMRSPG